MENIYLLAFGTFGNPYGFRQSFIVYDHEYIAKSIKTFDLNTNAIKLFSNSTVYSIRREYSGGKNIIAYSIYTYAKEQNSDRGGTFIGSSMLFTDKIADENITISTLNEFHKILTNNNVENDIIKVNHSDNFTVTIPEDLDKLQFNLKEIKALDFPQPLNKALIVYTEIRPVKLQKLFKKAIDLLNVYNTIYFTDNEEVATFVHQKCIFKLAKNESLFEQEIQYLQLERERKVQLAITDFEKEKQKLEENKRRSIDDYKSQIEHNRKLHQENEKRINESEKDIEIINQIYQSHQKEIEGLIVRLKSDKKLDEIKQLYDENKKAFINSINQHHPSAQLNSIAKPRSNVYNDFGEKHSQHNHHDVSYLKKRDNKEHKTNVYKIISLFLFLLLTCTVYYFLFFNEHENVIPLTQSNTQQVIAQSTEQSTNVNELNPVPNSALSEESYQLIGKKIRKDMSLDEVVQIIFENNQTNIKQPYLIQKDIYAKQIIYLNRDCFKDSNNTYYLIRDTLKHIPTFQK